MVNKTGSKKSERTKASKPSPKRKTLAAQFGDKDDSDLATYPGPNPGTAVFVDFGAADGGSRRQRLAVLTHYTKGDEPKPMCRVASVDAKGALTGEMGVSRTFELRDILGVAALMRGAANDDRNIACAIFGCPSRVDEDCVGDAGWHLNVLDATGTSAAFCPGAHAKIGADLVNWPEDEVSEEQQQRDKAKQAKAISKSKAPPKNEHDAKVDEITARLVKCQHTIDTDLLGPMSDADRAEYKLAVTCTCSKCSADVGELCVKKTGRGRNVKLVAQTRPCTERVDAAEKAAALIAQKLGSNADGYITNAAKTVEKERAKVERQGTKALARATGNAVQKPGPVDRAVAAAAQPGEDPRLLDDVELEERIANFTADVEEVSESISEIEQSDPPKHVPQEVRDELGRLIGELTDLKMIRHERRKQREKAAAAQAQAVAPAGGTKPQTLAQKQASARKTNAPKCAYVHGRCELRQVDGHGQLVKFGDKDERWVCDEHVPNVFGWLDSAKEWCAYEGCASYFVVRDMRGEPVFAKPNIVNPPDHWWVHEENEPDRFVRKCYGPCHRRDGERETQAYEREKGITSNRTQPVAQLGEPVEVLGELPSIPPPPRVDGTMPWEEPMPWDEA